MSCNNQGFSWFKYFLNHYLQFGWLEDIIFILLFVHFYENTTILNSLTVADRLHYYHQSSDVYVFQLERCQVQYEWFLF